MNLYKIKHTLLTPYIWYMRYKERNASEIAKQMYEVTGYNPALYRLFEAAAKNPDILIEAPGLGPDSLVWDVGAFDGDWSARVFEKYRARIYTFEIEPNFHAQVTRRFESNSKIRCFGFGLGDKNANLMATRAAMGTTLYPDGDVGAAADQIEVPVRDVVEVMDELGSPSIDLMKINIEGGEYGLLERMIAAERVRDVRCFMIQFHEWIDGSYRRRNAIRKALRQTHDVRWEYTFCWEQWVRKES